MFGEAGWNIMRHPIYKSDKSQSSLFKTGEDALSAYSSPTSYCIPSVTQEADSPKAGVLMNAMKATDLLQPQHFIHEENETQRG